MHRSSFLTLSVALAAAITSMGWMATPSANAQQNVKIGFVGTEEPTVGDFKLYWRGDEGNTKNAEFRNSGDGDTFCIEKVNDSGQVKIFYVTGSGKYYLFWRGDEGNTKNAEFRKGDDGDTFILQRDNDGQSKLLFVGPNEPTLGVHYLYWRGDQGGTKNAEFRKGGEGDTFYIRSAN